MPAIVGGFVFSSTVGIFFCYPAPKAANLDSIDALRQAKCLQKVSSVDGLRGQWTPRKSAKDMQMKMQQEKAEAAAKIATPAAGRPADIATASVPDTLTGLRVNASTGLSGADANIRRKEHGYNEVAVEKAHPITVFLKKFWGMSAWMLELILVLSAVRRNYADLVVVSALLLVNAIVSFMQERRAAGVVEALRKRLQVNARVLRDGI